MKNTDNTLDDLLGAVIEQISEGFIWSYKKSDYMQPIAYTGRTNNKVKTKLK